MAKTLDEDAIERHKEALIEPAATLYAVQKVFGDQAKAKSMAAYGRLIDAHMLATGVLASGILRINGAVVEGDQTTFERDALFAALRPVSAPSPRPAIYRPTRYCARSSRSSPSSKRLVQTGESPTALRTSQLSNNRLAVSMAGFPQPPMCPGMTSSRARPRGTANWTACPARQT